MTCIRLEDLYSHLSSDRYRNQRIYLRNDPADTADHDRALVDLESATLRSDLSAIGQIGANHENLLLLFPVSQAPDGTIKIEA